MVRMWKLELEFLKDINYLWMKRLNESCWVPVYFWSVGNVNPSGFIESGLMNGTPNQRPPRVK